MNTQELANRLRALEACATDQELADAFHMLQVELEQDGLELGVDKDHCFAVRELGRVEAAMAAGPDWKTVATRSPVALSAFDNLAIFSQDGEIYTVVFRGRHMADQHADEVNALLMKWGIPADQGWFTPGNARLAHSNQNVRVGNT